MTIHRYWTRVCGTCALKAPCTPGTERRVSRWEHEAVLDRMEERLNARPETMQIRRQSVEPVFGTLKGWMGSTHFLTRTLNKVAAEISLHGLAYKSQTGAQDHGHPAHDSGDQGQLRYHRPSAREPAQDRLPTR